MKVLTTFIKQEPGSSTSAKKKEVLDYYPCGKKKIYKLCGECDYKATTNFALDRHFKLAHPSSTKALIVKPRAATDEEEQQFHCTLCPFKNRSKTALKRHEVCHRNKSAQHHCNLCGFSVNNRGNLTLHMKLHSRESGENTDSTKGDQLIASGSSLISPRHLLSCRHCPTFKTPSLFILKRHVKRAHPFSLTVRPPPPPQLVEPSANAPPEGAEQEKKTTNREEWYLAPSGSRKRYIYCGDCDYRTIFRFAIEQHAKAFHPDSTTAVLSPSSKGAIIKPWRCAQCDFTTKYKQELVWHRRFHENRAELKCELCSYSCTTSHQLKLHLAHHHKGIPKRSWLLCSLCGYRGDRVKNFQNHEALHRIKSKFQCHLCSYSVSKRGNLILHLERHHTEKTDPSDSKVIQDDSEPSKDRELWHCFPCGKKRKYKFCGECDYKTTSDFALDRHIERVHPSALVQPPTTGEGEQQFYCAHCPFKSRFKAALKRHDASHRNESAEHHCNLCSFSASCRGYLDFHMKLHYRDSGEHAQLRREKAAAISSSLVSRGDLLSCRHCHSFKTASRFVLKRHVKRVHPFSPSALIPPLPLDHKKPNNHQVVEPSASPAPEETLDQIETVKREEWYVPPSGVRKRYIYCGDCDYRTTVRISIKRHAEMMHPSSTTAIPAPPPKEDYADSSHSKNQKSNGNSTVMTKKSKHECSFCSYRTDKANKILSHEALHRIKSAFQCHLCSYSVNKNCNLVRHLNRHHPLRKSKTNVENAESSVNKGSIENKMKKKRLRTCKECDYSTCEKAKLIMHVMNHRRNGRFKCQFCTFTSDFKTSIPLHLKYGHRRNLEKKAVPSRIQGVELEANLRKQFGIKECRVILQDISSSLSKIINLENAELLPSKEANQIVDKVQAEDDEKIQLLQSRLEAMEERARIAEEEVKEITLKKVDLQKRIKEIAARKVVIEYDLRSEQCNLIEMNLSALETEDEDYSGIMKPVEEKIKSFEKKMNVIESELMALKEEERNIVIDLEDAQASHIGIVQVLKALQSELNGLLTSTIQFE